jgi:hypothetical protein
VQKNNDLEVMIRRFGGVGWILGGVLRGLGDPERSSVGLRGILVLGEFEGIGGLGFDRTRPRVETA